METEDRELAMEIINKMMEIADKTFEEKSLDPYLKFKIICREERQGDFSLGEEITIDQMKELEEKQWTKQSNILQ